MKSRALKIIAVALVFALYGSTLIHAINISGGDDLPRFIKNGEMTLETRDVLYTNFYSYTEPEHPFLNHHWFASVIFYIVHQLGGFVGLTIFKTIILLATLAILLRIAIKRSNFWLAICCSLPTILLLRERTEVRPEIFSYLFIALFLYLLSDFDRHAHDKQIYWLIPLQLLWVNSHIFFIIGPLLIAGLLFEKIVLDYRNIRSNPLIRKLALLFVSVIIVCFLNPAGLDGVLRPLHMLDNYSLPVLENQPLLTSLHLNAAWDISAILFIPFALIFLGSFVFSFRKKPIFYFLACAATIFVGFAIIRGIPFMGIMFLPIVAENLNAASSKIKERLPKKTLIGVFIVLFLYCLISGVRGVLSREVRPGIGLVPHAHDAAVFIKEHDIEGPIFNDADSGSYLIYELFPKHRVFVDNRFHEVYSPHFLNDVYWAALRDEKVWQQVQEQYHFNIIFFNEFDALPDAGMFLARRFRDPTWALVFANEYSVIFVKNTPENKKIIDQFQITQENIGDRLQPLVESSERAEVGAAGHLFNLMGRLDLAAMAFENIVTTWPETTKAWTALGIIETIQNNAASNELAITHFQKAIELGEKTAEVYTFLGLAYFQSGHFQQAEVMLKKALRVDPSRGDAQNYLSQLQTYLRS